MSFNYDKIKIAIFTAPSNKQKYVVIDEQNGMASSSIVTPRRITVHNGRISSASIQFGLSEKLQKSMREENPGFLKFLVKKFAGRCIRLPGNKDKIGLILDFHPFDLVQRDQYPFYQFIIDVLVDEQIYKICWFRPALHLANEVKLMKKEFDIYEQRKSH